MDYKYKSCNHVKLSRDYTYQCTNFNHCNSSLKFHLIVDDLQIKENNNIRDRLTDNTRTQIVGLAGVVEIFWDMAWSGGKFNGFALDYSYECEEFNYSAIRPVCNISNCKQIICSE
jgi:hypothetical protein